MTWVSHTAGDLCAVRSTPARAQPAHAALVLTACILASSLAFVDGSVVNVGLPVIGQSLKGNAEGLQWVIGTVRATFLERNDSGWAPRSCCGGRRDPRPECITSKDAKGRAGGQVLLGVEGVVDGCVGGEESLG